MDSISYYVFENPLWVCLVLGMVELGLFARWRQGRTRGQALAMLGPVTLAAIVLILAMAVETDREQIMKMAAEIAADVQSDRSEALQKYLDDKFVGYYEGAALNRTTVLVTSKAAKRAHSVSKIRILDAQVTVEGKWATMKAPVRMEISQSIMTGDITVLFKLKWVKRPQGWRLIEAAEPELQRF